ncbi:Phosphatidylinositol 3,4,5-trisphosphate 5-phosphatase [Melia azedarach]|uniref:Phosphatidylinositol 3,4,5-trisphosphate 5-phosphatase n=1 Tax=Melia azedarach TaxID=155640 RepID=A0ACC1XCB1_MELAZ|nr:Phosphatidylinositol 3,4,5-trisphosphate 5-phosphatase [Melia azedarach]
MAWITATIAMITALCIRKKSAPPPNSSVNKGAEEKKSSEDLSDTSKDNTATPDQETTIMTPPSPQAARTSTDEEEGEEQKLENDNVRRELPLPPAMKTLRGAYSCNNLTRTMSMRRVDTSSMMSMKKMPRSISVRNDDVHNNNKKKKKKAGILKTEDSVWKKTIILGEKCRPDEEDDGIIYDNKGNKITAYHKKTQSNYSLSRTSSRVDHDIRASPVGRDKDKGVVRKDHGDKDENDEEEEEGLRRQKQQLNG